MPNDTTTPAGTPREAPAVEGLSPARPPERTSSRDPGSAPEADPGAKGYRAVLAVREFRAVFAAHLLSLLGVTVSELALTVLVYDLTGSPLLSALTFALGFLPYVVGGTLFAGVADRYPARRVLVTCDLICAGCVAVMVLPGTPVGVLLALRCAVAAVAPAFTGTRRRPSPTSSARATSTSSGVRCCAWSRRAPCSSDSARAGCCSPCCPRVGRSRSPS